MSNQNAVEKMGNAYQSIKQELNKIIVGQDEVVENILICLFSEGHILIEGVPGLGKTLIVSALSRILDADFKRIQFTPDLMPSDITGTTIFDSDEKKFIIKKGPVFTNLLLADEINRSPAKTQSALLQAMQEKSVSIDGTDYDIEGFFICLATQNPIEMEGTYPLPEAQIDRFLMKSVITYPSAEQEIQILRNYRGGFSPADLSVSGIKPVLKKEEVTEVKNAASTIVVDDGILRYIANIVNSTRDFPGIAVGSSPRGSIALFQTSRIKAVFEGRDYVIPDDIKGLCHPVLRHRLILEAEAEIEGFTSDDYIEKILNETEIPR